MTEAPILRELFFKTSNIFEAAILKNEKILGKLKNKFKENLPFTGKLTAENLNN